MALIPTLLALGVGVALGLRWGGSISNVAEWRPELWQLGLGGVSLLVITDVIGFGGTPAVLLRIVALGLITAFAVLNVTTGGMVLVAVGFGLNFLVTLINWGMPTSASALASAGIADSAEAASALVLNGGREVADGALLGFLGDVIPLPWGQVISIGDIIWLVGLALVTASVMRRYEVGRRGRPGARRGRSGNYSDSLSALGRGPAPRKGPGLHPSRLGERRPGRPTL
ncbi:MAG: DUF5317 family protein [Microthrixaceae bacterium]|nr:DUF5317 family protein [Microthrixaceae bacterium]MCB1012512.1 DUF5317 family protein [Microthrixaceae bacterium]